MAHYPPHGQYPPHNNPNWEPPIEPGQGPQHGHYPPGHYPPGHYPPGQYPPGPPIHNPPPIEHLPEYPQYPPHYPPHHDPNLPPHHPNYPHYPNYPHGTAFQAQPKK